MRPLILLSLIAAPAHAATILNYNFTVNNPIPDNSDLGFADYRNISAPGLTEIESITVALNFTGGWNGDLYAHLRHDSGLSVGFSVLLNRPGRTGDNPDGAGSAGMSITLDDSAAADVHTAMNGSGTVFGTYQPDARTADPLLVTDLSTRSAFLSSFTGLDPNGTWSLFVADQSPGAISTLQSWSLNISAIPEPSHAVPLGIILGSLLLSRRRNLEL